MSRSCKLRAALLCVLMPLFQQHIFAAGVGLETSTKLSNAEQYLFMMVNQERTHRDLPALSCDGRLMQAAAMHAQAMAAHEEVAHRFQGEADLAERGTAGGALFSLISENVAEAPVASELHRMWMDSEAHRANLLDPQVNRVGIAVVEHHGELYAVEDFVNNVDELSLPAKEDAVAGVLAGMGLQVGKNESARRTCAMAAGYEDGNPPSFIMRYSVSRLETIPPEFAMLMRTGKYRTARIGACRSPISARLASYNIAVLLYQ